MKLTRKQVINILETLKLEWGELAPPEDNICDALVYAIDDIKKLEMVEQIVNDRYGKPTFKFMDEIIKVVEDGNVN